MTDVQDEDNDKKYSILFNDLHCKLEDLIASVYIPPSSSNIHDSSDSSCDLSVLEQILSQREGLNSNVKCLLQRLAVLLNTSDPFEALTSLNSSTGSTSLTASLLCGCKYSSIFLNFHRLAHLADIVEITKRVRGVTINPWNCKVGSGSRADLAIRANYALADAVDDTLRVLDGLENNMGIDSEAKGMVKVYMYMNMYININI
jgi:hypothetical protein